MISTPHELANQKLLQYYTPIAMLFVMVLMLANILVQKVIAIGPMLLTAGDFMFPLAYLCDGLLTEVYGYAASRRIIWLALAINVLMAVLIKIAILLPGAASWNQQQQFELILGRTSQIVFASLIAFFCGEFINSYLIAKLKIYMRGKLLWLRAFLAMAVGQGLDTFVFGLIAFWGFLSWHEILVLNMSVYAFKICYEIVLTPLISALIKFLKQQEKIDVYDRGTNFNPFKVSWV